MIQVTVTNIELSKFSRSMKKVSSESKKNAQREIIRSANRIQNKAIGYAPRSSSVLAGSYRVIPGRKGLGAEVFSAVNYAPYVEFGTGAGVRRYAYFREFEGLKQYAAQFKGRGIRKRDKKPVSHLYRAVFKEQPKLIKSLEKAFNND